MYILEEYVKQKWKNLRDQFRKELQKIPVMRSGDEVTVTDVKWPYFQSMIFLKDILQPRPTKSSLDKYQCLDDNLESLEELNDSENYEHYSIDHSNNNCENDQVSDNASCFKRPSSESVVNYEESSQIKKSKTKKSLHKAADGDVIKMTEFEKHMVNLESQKLQMIQGTEDEDLNFFKSLLPYFKKLPDLSKMNVRTQMQNIVFQEYTKVIQMNDRYSTMNNNTNVRSVSTPSSSEISPVPSPGSSRSSSATQRYYESFTEKPTENLYYGIPTDNWAHDF